MDLNPSILSNSEKLTFALRSLYSDNGYSLYRMSKFEEYDLYSRNKDFLVSDAVITFTDLNGRLMALKPDVTLSIIKNTKDCPNEVKKLCYDENVYRVSKGRGGFREIMQSGVECIGAVDTACVSGVLRLAADSLAVTEKNYVIEVSHLGMLSYLLDGITTDAAIRGALLKCVSGKNIHGIRNVCAENGIGEERARPLIRALSTYGEPEKVLPALKEFEGCTELAAALSFVSECGYDGRFIIDLSAVGDFNYYNGIIFRGFVEGVPGSVLSGGQYDKLMRKMGRQSHAVGFAVYTDMLERRGEE